MMKIFFSIIFALFFIAIAIFIALETAIPTYSTWQKMQSWQYTLAEITELKPAENKTEASYRYTVDNLEYRNDRVYVAPFNDNIGSYHQNLYQQLLDLKNADQLIDIWYDPNNPADSVIDRDMRWGLFALNLVFCLFFALVGMFIMLVGVSPANKRPTNNAGYQSSAIQRRRLWQQQEGESYQNSTNKEGISSEDNSHDIDDNGYQTGTSHSKIWLTRKQWQTQRIRSDAKSSLIGIWIFALIWTAVCLPLIFVIEDELREQNYIALVAVLFPLIGLLLLIKAWHMTREWLKYGVIELHMDPFPGSIGGDVGGSFQINNIRQFKSNYEVELQCVYSYSSGSGENRSRRETIKWLEKGVAKVELSRTGVKVSFVFNVPGNLPESSVQQQGDYYFWRLKLTSNATAIKLDRNYNIPVFKTQQQSLYIRHNISEQTEHYRETKAHETYAAINSGDLSSTALSRSLIYKDKQNQQILYFPMFRNKILSVVALLFGAGFSFAAYSINQDFSNDSVMSIGMMIFSLPFATVGFVGIIAAVYLPLNNLSVTLKDRNITAIRRLFIFPIKINRIQYHEINKLEIKSSGSTGDGAAKIKHYKIYVLTNNKQKITIAEDIDGEDLANQFKEFLSKKLFLQ